MAQTIKLKRSNTAGNLPTTTDLALGEVGINTKDGKFFIRKHVDGTDSGDAITMYAPQGLNTYGTQTLEVKVITKSAAHPQYGTGSASGFSIDGLESPFITLIPGNTYRFDQADSSNTGHPLAFYLEEDKTTSYTTGVTSSGTAGSASAYVEIAVTTDTPQVLYYQCSSHAYMGSGAYALSDAIANGKVDTDQLAANAVTSAKIAANAITSSELAANSVGSTQIAANAVGTAEIAENSVSTSEIASNSITSALIASNAITTSEIAENSVSTSEIASNAITSALIAANAVGTDEIADNAITSAKIAANAIGSSELASSGVTAASYGSSSAVPVLTIDADGRITAASTQAISGLAANAVTSTEIAANAVNSSEIAANAVGSSEIAANAVTSAKIAANAVDTAEIASNAVTSAQLAGNSVSTSEIAANSVGISELNVSDGTNGQVLSTDGNGTLSFIDQSGGSGLSSNAVTSAYIASNAVLSRHIAANAIGASEIASSGVTAGSYTNADITIDADGRISAASNGSSASLADNSVTSAKIAANAVGSSEIASSGVTAGTYGSSTASPQITVDADGRISSVSNVTISSSGGGGGVGLNQTISQYSTTGDGSTTAFNTSITITNENLTWIFIDGVYQQKDSYSTSSSTVTFSAAPPNGTTIEVMVLESITTGGAFGHNSFNGDGSTTDFTLGQTPSADTDLIVFVDGVYQNADSFNVSGSDISFDTAPANGTKIIAYVIGGVVTGKVQIVDNFSGDASTTAFTLSLNPVSENNTDVYIDGVYQQKSEYSVSGTTLTFSSAPPSGTNNIEVLIGQVTTTTSMGANSVTSTAIAANAVGSSEIASSAVDTAQIAANAVTAAKIAANAIGSSEIAANAVTDVQIGGNAVTSVHIAANAVGSSEIAANSVGADELDSSASPTFAGLTTTGDINFGDNDKAVFGADSDLQIYHDGTFSHIKDNGTGNLYIAGDNEIIITDAAENEYKARFNTNGSVQLYYDNAEKLATTATGIDVTGTVTADGLTIDGNATISTAGSTVLLVEATGANDSRVRIRAGTSNISYVEFADPDDADTGEIRYDHTTNSMQFRTNNNVERMRIDSSGNVGIGTDNPVDISGQNSLTINGSVARVDLQVSQTTTGSLVSESGYIHLQPASGGKALIGNGGSDLVVDSSGNVGIGTSSPSSFYSGADNLVVGTGSGEQGITIYGGNASTSYLLFADGTSGADLYAGQVNYSHANNALNFLTNGITTPRMTIDSSGNVGIRTDSPSSYYSKSLVVSAANEDGITIVAANGATTYANYLMFADGTTGNERYRGWLGYDHNTDSFNIASHGFLRIYIGSTTQECMRIDSSGNVGIGTNSPSSFNAAGTGIATVSGTGTGASTLALYSDTTSSGYLYFSDGTSGADRYRGYLEYSHANDDMRLGTANTERMRIDSSGNLRVGISNSVPANNTEAGFLAGSASGYASCFIQIPNNAVNGYGILGFYAGSTLLGNITKTGSNSCAYNTSSDYRLKENVNYDFNALDRVAQLKPARFNFIADADKTVDGFLAHEVQDIVPEAITGVKDEMQEEEYEVTPAVLDEDGNVVTEAVMGTREVPKYQGIDQSKLVPLLTKAIQEQQTIIEDLKARIETLENN